MSLAFPAPRQGGTRLLGIPTGEPGTRRVRLHVMRSSQIAFAALALLTVFGCGGAPGPVPPPVPRSTPAYSAPAIPVSTPVDSVGSIPGSPDAQYIYRFRQIEPGSDRFAFRDRDLSFYFRPSPTALYFEIENLQGRPVHIDWERSSFVDPLGRRDKVGHASSTYRDRFSAQGITAISGQQKISEYVFPMDYLLDPGGRDEQIRQPLMPEDSKALTYSGRTFGVDLVVYVEDRPRTYTFRFEVVSVIPR